VREPGRGLNDNGDREDYDREARSVFETLDRAEKRFSRMPEVFRKHYSYGETIPILDTFVGMTADIFEVSERSSDEGPFIKAVLTALAGPMKSSPMIVEPICDNDSKVVSLTNIPVPIPSVRTVDISLIFDLVNYRWTQSEDVPRSNGVVTFDLRLRAAFSLLGRSYTLQLDRRPCAITLATWRTPVQTYAGSLGFENDVANGRQQDGHDANHRDRGTTSYERGQLDVEERLRQLGSKLLVRS
jgi:hypothetical protein